MKVVFSTANIHWARIDLLWAWGTFPTFLFGKALDAASDSDFRNSLKAFLDRRLNLFL